MRISLIINIQIYKLIMLITVYIVLLLLNKLIDMGGAPEAQYRRCEAAVKSGNKRGDIRLPVARQGVKPLPDPTFYHDYVRG